ncbi:histone deacetylase, SIR2 family [Blastocladiella britannica]|nr:histone deacetylase, SIR2 family [Blastocladiella britannica]
MVLGPDPPDQWGLHTIADRIRDGRAKRIVVACGAGISTAAGIPDFRSPGTGLYANLQKYNLEEPEDIFCIEFFRETPEPFFALAKELYPGRFKPTRTHHFLVLLSRHQVLQRVLTQNIDMLELAAGVPTDLVIHAHGSFATASCLDCRHAYTADAIRAQVLRDEVPRCTECSTAGLVKPDIVFFGESLPKAVTTAMHDDLPAADLLLVLGTSLSVAPFNLVPDFVEKDVPRVLVNRERVGDHGSSARGFDFTGKVQKYRRDLFVGMSTDDAVTELAEHLGWLDELLELERESDLADALAKVEI